MKWLENGIKIHGVAGKQYVFQPEKAGKRLLFYENWLEFQISYQWTPCECIRYVFSLLSGENMDVT